MRESQQEHSLARARESRQLEEWPLESMASVCQSHKTKVESAWGKETFSCSSGFSGSRGGVDSGKSFASQKSGASSLLCQGIGCGQEPK